MLGVFGLFCSGTALILGCLGLCVGMGVVFGDLTSCHGLELGERLGWLDVGSVMFVGIGLGCVVVQSSGAILSLSGCGRYQHIVFWDKMWSSLLNLLCSWVVFFLGMVMEYGIFMNAWLFGWVGL